MGFWEFFNKRKRCKDVKVGLALGGGGARGFAHLGAIKALEENGIKFDYIAGTSAGSVVGALYSAGLSIDDIIEKAKKLQVKDVRKNKLMPSKTDGIENLIIDNAGNITFKDLKIPFCAVAVDIKSGKEVDIKTGNLSKAVAGSCAVPGIFNPVDFGNFRLMDGGLQNNIPSDVVKSMGANVVISVDANPSRGYGTDSTKLMDIISASIRILMKSNSVKGRLFADVLIEPDTKRFKSTKIFGVDELIKEGYDSAISKMDEIKELLNMTPNKRRKGKNVK